MSEILKDIGGWENFVQVMGVTEGTANILAALFLGEPRIGKFDYYEAAVDINNFVRLPDLVQTTKQYYEQAIQGTEFQKHYPKTVEFLKNELVHPSAPDIMGLSFPYVTSSAINQPIWNAALRFSSRGTKLTYLKAISELKRFTTYDDLANALLKAATALGEKELAAYLRTEFGVRGLRTLN